MAFYYNDNGLLSIGPNFVHMPNGIELYADQKDTYTYPIEGWYWFDTTIEAKQFFGIPLDGNDIAMDQESANRF